MSNQLNAEAAAVQVLQDHESLDASQRGEATRELEKFLRSRIVGQDAAIEAVVELYQIFSVGMCSGDRPIGSLLFLGPTGSGKTYVIEVLAEALFGNPRAFIKIDCAEFQEHHEISKLIGSPPGYIGHMHTPPLLTQEALARWHTDKLKLSLLLFDEIEKASEALWQLLLGILDKATLTLGDNSQVDLSQCLIFMTSNLGATEMSRLAEGGIGFAAQPSSADTRFDEKIARSATEAARKKFSPEFMNRLDKIVVFNTLRPAQLEQILDLELAKVQRRITHAVGPNHFTFRCTPEAKRWLLREGTDPKYGARHLKRVIERNIVYGLANLVATGQIKGGECITVDMKPDGSLGFSKAGGNAGTGSPASQEVS
ncbi:MAG TPA: AAA family ATPase [Terriglobales bacterium]|nr:AAA family ATPase [Terriglobales bacterium]